MRPPRGSLVGRTPTRPLYRKAMSARGRVKKNGSRKRFVMLKNLLKVGWCGEYRFCGTRGNDVVALGVIQCGGRVKLQLLGPRG